MRRRFEHECACLDALQAEVLEHNDTVIVRGEEAYSKLPNKTFRLLRYMTAHPAGESGRPPACKRVLCLLRFPPIRAK